MEGSHWLNAKVIIDELIKKEHNVTILVASGALFIMPTSNSSLTFEVYKVAFGKEVIERVIKDFILTWMENRPSPSTIWRFYQEIAKVLKDFHMVCQEICDGVLKNQKLMEKLRKSKFEVLVSDPVIPCGDIIALKLGIPFVYSLRFSPASTVEKHCGKVPYPPSYVPAILSELTDQMSFIDRIRNFISYHLQDYMFDTLWKSWDSYYSKALVTEIVLSGNVLIWPTDGSHWLNIKIILEELIQRNHNVTVLASSATLFIKSNPDSPVHFEVIPVSYKKSNIDSLIEHMIMLWIDHRPTPLTLWTFYKELGKLLDTFFRINIQICDGVLNNPKLMARLQKGGYDVLVADPVTICGDLVALKLGIPFMYTLRFSPASTVERHCGKIPAPASYVPAALSELTDQMTFGERVKNTISYSLQDYIFQSYWGEWNSYYSEVLGIEFNKSSFGFNYCFIHYFYPSISISLVQVFNLCQAVCEGAAVMISEKWILSVLLLRLCFAGCGFCGKVLVWPCDVSHWLNMKTIPEKLAERGHEVTVLVSPQTFTIDYSKPSTLNF
ncbi:hypothetical protein HPG69_001424 [Diceros bicornis minor]|uniref:UDP-glycosyltransferase n=1 Tax=Diceros bicornis minor TaxID=77932 RepID=A0A7J7FGE0_DICBM|nr:hypothetical protein HPG69_001424 [Diceros bicornis minor]